MSRPVLHNYYRSSTSFRVRAALALKGIEYDYVSYHLGRGDHRTDSYHDLNAQNLVPTLVWSDGSVITQSLAIIEYLDEVVPEPALLPTDALGRARVRSLAQAVALDIHPVNNLRVLNYLRENFGSDQTAVTSWFCHWVAETFAALEERLSSEKETGRFCHGDTVTLADLCLAAQLTNNTRFGVNMSPYPTINRIGAALLEVDRIRQAQPDRQPDAE